MAHPRSLVVAVLVGALAVTAACSSTEGNEAYVRDRIDRVWRAGGVDPGDAHVLGYRRLDRPRSPACAALPEGDRWWGKQTATLPPHVVDQATLLRRLAEGLAADGYEVRRFRSTGSDTRVLDALHPGDGVYLQLYVTADGGASLDVKAGPCAPAQRAVPDGPYMAEG